MYKDSLSDSAQERKHEAETYKKNNGFDNDSNKVQPNVTSVVFPTLGLIRTNHQASFLLVKSPTDSTPLLTQYSYHDKHSTQVR